MKTNKLMLCAVAVLGGLYFAPMSHADSYTLQLTQTGANQITATGSGTIDLSGLAYSSSGSTLDFISGSPTAGEYFVTSGAASISSMGQYDEYTGITGPANFGTGTGSSGIGSGTGDFVGINTDLDYILVPTGYVSGATLSSSATYAASFATLGLTSGTSYTYNLGNGSTFTIDVGTPAPTPEPGSFALLGTGVLGLAGMLRRRLS